jgi:GTP cyclohydrolase II
VFSYVDLSIRQRLAESEKLVDLDRAGRALRATPGGGQRPYISLLGPVPLPRSGRTGDDLVSWYVFVRRTELEEVSEAADRVRDGHEGALRDLLQTTMSVNSVLATPGFAAVEEPLVRVHSCCLTGDVFGSRRCECGPQLDHAFEQIVAAGGGAIVYMSSHEGRGIGLWAKAITYLLQDEGQDTYQANVSLGLPEDSRDFTDAAVVLRYLFGGRPVRLLSNNPLKREHLERAGQPVSAMEPIVIGVNEHNRRYMRSKREKGHDIPAL